MTYHHSKVSIEHLDTDFKDFLSKGTNPAILSHYKALIHAVEFDLVKYERECMRELFN
jgi:hypothetical protein